ncbi:MAG: HAD family hydrolase [Lachnospiraceae bacterium]
MMRQPYLFFDLDGTLTDPKVGITKSVAHALEYYGIHVEDPDVLCPFIGPPLTDSFQEFYGLTMEQAREGVLKFREYFEVTGLYENQVYPGMESTLARLQAAGFRLMVATSKPEAFAKKILEHFHMDGFFQFIGGADMEETRVRKGDVIRYVLEQNQITDLSSVIMIGDRKHDILGAKEQGLRSIGVLYGYGDREELTAAGADWIAEDVSDLERIVNGLWIK